MPKVNLNYKPRNYIETTKKEIEVLIKTRVYGSFSVYR